MLKLPPENMPMVGTFMATARCIGPVSLLIKRLQRLIMADNCLTLVFSGNKIGGIFRRGIILSNMCWSVLLPVSKILAWYLSLRMLATWANRVGSQHWLE